MQARRLMTALVMALLVSGVFTFWLSRKFAKPHEAVTPKLLYMATAKALDAGEVLTASDLTTVDWPMGTPLEGAHTNAKDLIGRSLLFPLPAGQPLLDQQMSAPGAGIGLSAKIPDGMRALSLRSDDVVGVAGFLLPGTRVDVLVTLHPAGSIDPVTQVVLQDVQVLTAGQNTTPDGTGKAVSASVVTLMVTPDQAQKVVLATAEGSVHFILRNGNDHEMSAEVKPGAPKPERREPVRVAPRPVQAAVIARQPYVVQTVNGSTTTTEKFQ
ncbi:pilus assembly protein CpaB [Bryocella elongata]|uniref:Pilus assembly protein CpaB n=1 Tax=Bryocella elongata TaxID=863522 RepID=A0A1H5WMN9_9BACT|nr:Flp pilus assembly protein CpaB [Bryocella elongata]SEG00237.1 pilus assembly protein CpaB [Bryocella elongata]